MNKIITAFAPSVPIWAVFYDEDVDELVATPVVAMCLVEGEDEEITELWREIRPYVLFGADADVVDPSGCFNFLGYDTTDKPKKSDWRQEILWLKRLNNIKAGENTNGTQKSQEG